MNARTSVPLARGRVVRGMALLVPVDSCRSGYIIFGFGRVDPERMHLALERTFFVMRHGRFLLYEAIARMSRDNYRMAFMDS